MLSTWSTDWFEHDFNEDYFDEEIDKLKDFLKPYWDFLNFLDVHPDGHVHP